MSFAAHPLHRQYRWHHELRELFVLAVERYRAGEREPARFFTPEQTVFLASIGQTPQEIFDFADDHVRYDDGPDWDTYLLISAARRDYFRAVQHEIPDGKTISTDDLPPKNEKLGGIPWLPRLIKKAEAKLRGEMSPDLMYGCAGDRNFFREHCVHPADFLRVVWGVDGDPDKILAYVRECTPVLAGEPEDVAPAAAI